MYEISVIVPIYNVQRWLPRCIDSLINQSVFPELEIILVDDGSSDSSGIICDDYALRYDNIVAFHKQNGGVSSARNYGLDHSNGTYVAFVDADDYVDPHYYEKLKVAAAQHKADLVIGDYYLLFDDGKEFRYRSSNIKPHLWDRESALVAFFKGENIGVNLFDKIFKRSKIGTSRFDEKVRIGEDFLFIFQYLTTIKNVYGDFTPGYFYFQRSGSAMNGKFNEKYFDVINVSDKILDWTKSNLPSLTEYAEAMYIHSSYKTLERAYKAEAYKQYQERLLPIREMVRKYKIIKAYHNFSKKQFIGFVLMRTSKNLYLFVCKLKKI